MQAAGFQENIHDAISNVGSVDLAGRPFQMYRADNLGNALIPLFRPAGEQQRAPVAYSTRLKLACGVGKVRNPDTGQDVVYFARNSPAGRHILRSLPVW